MKRLTSLLLVLLLTFSLFGCMQPVSTQPTPSVSIAAPTTAPTTVPPTTVPPTTVPPTTIPPTTVPEATEPLLPRDGYFNSKEEVALYIHIYGCLPENYVTKDYCKSVLKCSTSRVQDFWCDGHGAIGGDVFQNREGLLPKKDGRTWTECDINTWGRYQRGAERIVFSNDGLVYYTADHYASFDLLYGEP